MSELSYKELQEQGVFNVPYRAFKYMQSQQDKIDLLEKELTETQAFLNKQNHIKQAKIDELQARIDGALKELELLNCYRTGNSDNAIDILKAVEK